LHIEIRESRVCTGTRLRAERCGVQIPAGAKDFSRFQNIQTDSVPAQSPRRDVQFTTHLNLVLRLRISGAIPLLLSTFSARIALT